VAALRCFADGADIAMAKRAWPQHKVIPVKWFNMAGKCSRLAPPSPQRHTLKPWVVSGRVRRGLSATGPNMLNFL
jgi:hypothetical protein